MDIYYNALEELKLNNEQYTQIELRVLTLIKQYSKNRMYYSILYYGGKTIITLGSILVPSLMTRDMNSNEIYIFVFIVSLLVTIANGLMAAFNIDIKFYVTQNVYFQTQSEFWQYYGLTGKYSGFYINGVLNHINQCKYFLNNVEKININYIERIYSKNIDKQDNKNIEELIRRVVPSNFSGEKLEKSPTREELTNKSNTVEENKPPRLEKIDIQ